MSKKVINKRPLENSYFKNIPGHYYDEKRRRLFKLAGNEFSSLPGVLTRDNIKEREVEDKRVKDLVNDLKSFKSNIKSTPCLLNQREMNVRKCYFEHEITSSFYSNLRCRGYVDSAAFMGKINSEIKFMACGPSSESLSISSKRTELHCLTLVVLNNSEKGLSLKTDGIISGPSPEFVKLHFSTSVKSSCNLVDKVVDYKFHDVNNCTIFTNTSRIKGPSHVYHVSQSQNSGYNAIELKEYIFSSACAGREMFAIGHEYGINLYNVQSLNNETIEPIRTFDSKKSQVHSAAFSKNNNILYYGDLHGHIRFCDLKNKHVLALMSFDKRARVDSLYECEDDNYLLTSFNDGRILMLDRRMKKFVLSYQDHKNDYMKIPIQMDQSGKYIAAVGIDCYTRIWDLKASHPIRSIPPPISTNRSLLPVISFMPGNHNFYTIPQLLLSIDKQIFVYS